MKRLFSVLIILFVISISTVSAQCCKSSAANKALAENVAEVEQNNELKDIKAYYFHLSRRCVTCKTVEKVSGDILKDLYGDDLNLVSVNIETEEGKKVAEKVGVNGQAMIFTNGDKTVNLISDGFMNARTKPEKLKEKIEETVNSLKE